MNGKAAALLCAVAAAAVYGVVACFDDEGSPVSVPSPGVGVVSPAAGTPVAAAPVIS